MFDTRSATNELSNTMRLNNAVFVWLPLLACGITLCAAHLTQSQPLAEPLEVSELAEGVFMHRGALALMTRENQGAIANVGFVVGKEAVAVIDTGGSVPEGRRLLAAIRARTRNPIRYIISTHAHPDHVFGHAAFEHENAVFVGHRKLQQAFAMRGQFYLDAYRRSMGDELIAEVKLIAPTKVVDDTLNLDLGGGRRLALKAWRTAHTDCDLTILDESSGSLFAGDLVVSQHIPVLDGSILGWLAVIDELVLMQPKRILPGHGPVLENSNDALAAQRRYLDRLAGDVRKLIVQGASISAAGLAAAAEKERWGLFEEYNTRNATAAFAELEWE
jgi:quinoprotein relay system zinc metallohydrolase 2